MNLADELRTASSFIHAMEKLGKSISSRNIVIGSTTELIDKYSLKDYPLITCSGEWLAIAAMRQPIQIFENPLPFSTELLIPFAVHNMPEIVEAKPKQSTGVSEIPPEGEMET